MKFSERLVYTKELCESYNLGAMMRMDAILESAPSVSSIALNRTEDNVCHVEMDGYLFGENGTWTYDFKFNDKNELDAFSVKFTEDSSSKKASADTYYVSLRALAEDMQTAPTPYKLMEVKLTRVNNYRFAHNLNSLSASEVGKLSRPEIISRSTIFIRNAEKAYIEESIKTKQGLRTLAKEKLFEDVYVMA